MELPIIAIFMVFWSSTVITYPINSPVLPKEYFQRQNLPEIPGYIPVYIKHDDEPLPKWKENLNTRTEDQADAKNEEQTTVSEKQASLIESAAPKEQPNPEQKSKTKKVTENFQTSKFKDNKE